MSFATFSYWLQHSLGFAFVALTALTTVALLFIGVRRLVQLRHAT